MIAAFVCTGNICRSPMAEAIATSLHLPGCEFVSVGTAPMTGWSASPEAVLIGAELGADLSGHRARGLEELELMEPEEVLTMEPHHTRAVLRRFPEWADRVHLLDPGGLAIADPYGLSTAHYRAARDQIVAALDIHARRWSA